MLSPIILAALCALALLVVASLRRIPEGHVYTFRRIGGHVRVVGSGTHWVVPLVERVAHKISLAGAVVAVEEGVGTAAVRRCGAAAERLGVEARRSTPGGGVSEALWLRWESDGGASGAPR